MLEPLFDTHASLDALVLYSSRATECRDVYNALGLAFGEEPGALPRGAGRYTTRLPLGPVLEIRPVAEGTRTVGLGLRLALDAAETDPPLARGEHLLTDPDGRGVAVTVR
ncbi:hypothetical protein [Nocardiopsis sp. NPDC006938]|uniref:hypothetical protein n=1 Tax=Nocardiopsis sp. NPDC006938 TaxID=3364337 RepID=UPI0036918336